MELDKDHPPEYSIKEAKAYIGVQEIVKKYDKNADIGYRKVEQSADMGLNVQVNIEYDDIIEKMKKEILDNYKEVIAELYSHSTDNFTIYFKN